MKNAKEGALPVAYRPDAAEHPQTAVPFSEVAGVAISEKSKR
jgi:hypothetical protein